jgi:4-amino-4-deoxy-L-arabinose transferase-like glycosyltransferase
VLPFLLASGDIVALITGVVSAVLNARIAGWNARSGYLLTAAVAVLSIPLAVALGGDTGLDIALPFYSLVLVALGVGLARQPAVERQPLEPSQV